MRKDKFRLGQRLCRVRWVGTQEDAEPFLEFGTVTKVTSRTYYINECKHRAADDWWESAEPAFGWMYRELLSTFGLIESAQVSERPAVRVMVQRITRLRRLERRLLTRGKTQGRPDEQS